NYYGIFRVIRSQRQNPGLLAVLVPTAGVEQAQRTLVGILIVLGLGLVAVVTLLAYRTARSITEPLASLASAAQRIEAGDLAARVPQRSPHEIGTLERAFDTMAQSLYERERAQREYLDEVRAVNEVADAVVGVTDAERIFARSLDRMVSLLNADGGAIVIREDPPGAPPGSGGRLNAPATLGIAPETAVSHELRTPMNAIIGYTKLMLDGLDGEMTAQQQTDLFRVAQAADNLLGLINGLLDLAKIEAGKMELNVEEVNITEVTDEALE